MANSCQVAFYVLESEQQSPEQVACWLSIKAWEQGHRVAVRTADANDAQILDELMWDFPPGRFLPHARGFASNAPVTIGTASEALEHPCSVLVNLAETPAPNVNSFERLLEIVPARKEHRLASREKFRQYRQLGLEPVSHPLKTQ